MTQCVDLGSIIWRPSSARLERYSRLAIEGMTLNDDTVELVHYIKFAQPVFTWTSFVQALEV